LLLPLLLVCLQRGIKNTNGERTADSERKTKPNNTTRRKIARFNFNGIPTQISTARLQQQQQSDRWWKVGKTTGRLLESTKKERQFTT